jgi:hypothetical protein
MMGKMQPVGRVRAGGVRMKGSLINLTYEIELQPDEKITLPEAIANTVGPGRWLLTIQPLDTPTAALPTRNHSAFLNSYVSADARLYDDYPAG